MIAPVGAGTFLYMERPGHTAGLEEGMDVFASLGRLVGAHLPEAQSPADGEVEAIPGLVGRSSAMRALAGQVASAAPTESPGPYLGRDGHGQGARCAGAAELSPRARGPFVPVNAAALGDELIESQLFGHVRGAFSGAVGDALGYVAAAEGGARCSSTKSRT